MNTIRRTLKSMLVVIWVLVSISCTPDHGRFVATIQPVCLRYDKYLLEWTSIQTIFYYDIYCKDNSYIAVYRSQGKADDEKELKVKANVFYNHNHPTYEYKYCIDDYYFNFDDLGE